VYLSFQGTLKTGIVLTNADLVKEQMIFLRILLVFGLLVIISVVLQFATVPFSAVHNTFELLESVERSFGGVIVAGLIWAAIRLVRGEQKAPEISQFLFYIAVTYLVLQAIYDLFAG
jgi:hypothetical protein